MIIKKFIRFDMMFAYLNLFKHDVVKINIKDILYTIEEPGWGDPAKKISYSPIDVLKNPKKKEYQSHMKRIKKANLKCPIIIDGSSGKLIVVDGVHRLTKAYLSKKKTIDAYIFDKKLMNKFLIDKKGNWNKVDNKLQMYYFIEIFYERFCS